MKKIMFYPCLIFLYAIGCYILKITNQYNDIMVSPQEVERVKIKIEPLSCSNFLAQPLSIPDPNNGTQILKETITTPKFNISIHNKEFDQVRWCIYEKGEYYETKLTELVQNTIRENKDKPNSIFLDVGGNIGWFSLVALAEGHEVVVFEPHPVNYLRFCQSIVANKWEDRNLLSLFPYGVGNVHGEKLTLKTGLEENPGGFSFEDSMSEEASTKYDYSMNIMVVTLDAIAEEKKWFDNKDTTIALMKVDVEGFEANVLKGATRLLRSKKIELITFEYKPSSVANETVDILVSHGYCLRMLGYWMGPSTEHNDKIPKTDENLKANLVDLCPGGQQLNLAFGCCDCRDSSGV